MQSLNILLFECIHPNTKDELVKRGHNVKCVPQAASKQELILALTNAHIVGIRSKTKLSEKILENAPELIAVGCFCIGTNQVDLETARKRGIAVFNAPFSNTRSVAELTIAEIIALHRKLCDKSAAMHKGKWDKTAAHAHDVRGRTLGIVGYGHIGSQVSVLGEALGMRIIFYDIDIKLPIGNAEQAASLEALLNTSDVVTLHVPETSATKNLISRRELELMKKGSFLINNARGSVVDIDALAEALTSNHLSGAAVDVFPQEPGSSPESFTSPICGLANVILTPHIGGSTEEAQIGIAHDVTTKLLRFIENGSTSSAINVPAVDLPQLRPEQHRILHFHQNVPGVLSKMHKLLADLNININAEYLQSDAYMSYVILDIDAAEHPPIHDGLHSIPETIRVRTLW